MSNRTDFENQAFEFLGWMPGESGDVVQARLERELNDAFVAGQEFKPTGAALDAAIKDLCMERFRADPEGYERFICELLPRVALHDGPYVFRDIGEKHSGTISATGRTTVTDID